MELGAESISRKEVGGISSTEGIESDIIDFLCLLRCRYVWERIQAYFLISQLKTDQCQSEKAPFEKTRVVMLVNTLGDPFDLKKVKEFCDRCCNI